MKKIRLTVDIEVDKELLEFEEISIEDVSKGLVLYPSDVEDGYIITTNIGSYDNTEDFFIKDMHCVSCEIIDY